MKYKVLLLSCLDIELNNPFFRLGAYEKYLFPLASKLEESGSFECSFMLRDHLFDLFASRNLMSDKRSYIVSSDEVASKNFEGFMIKSYDSSREDAVLNRESYKTFLKELLKGYTPDVIIIWESPSGLFRELFPNAVVLDLMPGFMSRPPYPKTISIDPIGIYKNCWYSDPILRKNCIKPKSGLLMKLRERYQSFFDELDCFSALWDHYDISGNKKIALVPLQISNYFGFFSNTLFRNQYEFLSNMCDSLKEDGIIATQYTGNFVSDKPLNESNIEYLCKYKKKVYYSDALNAVDSISQFILPFVSTVASVSSTLGMQAVFYGKNLFSPSCSHLNYLAEDKENAEKILEIVLENGQFFFEKAIVDSNYFAKIVIDVINKKKNGATGIDLLPNSAILETSYDNYLELSNFDAAKKAFSKCFDVSFDVSDKAALGEFIKAINAKGVKVVSFDVFDTLLRRTVGDPKDIFALIQKQLIEGKLHLPVAFTSNFLKLRVISERLLRLERDELLSRKVPVSEEILIDEIYERMQRISGIKLPISELVSLEQQVELEHLRPRKYGQLLLKVAKKNNKRIVINSDFVHPLDFVKNALRQCGYESFENYFVSSSTKVKKHSGAMFEHIINVLNVKPNEILHIGDNPVGDVKMPRQLGIRAIKLESSNSLLKTAFKNSKREELILKSSACARQVFNLYAERFFKLNSPRGYESKFELVSTLNELGYLLLGPMMYAFAKWVLDTAQSQDVKQVIFFARDCKLAYTAAKKLVKEMGMDIHCVYLEVSRKSCTCIEVCRPEDVFSVRIDDFSKQKCLRDLLEQRFLLPLDVNFSYCKYNITLDEKIGNIPLELQYQVIFDIVSKHWRQLKVKYEERRILYSNYLKSLGIDLSKSALGVDIGYQGSIHKKLKGLFKKTLFPCFFMTYGNGYGEAPILNAKVYYHANVFPFSKEDIFVARNLLFETLINEAIGTATNIYKNSKSEIVVSHDQSLPIKHLSIIKRLHRGAELFFDDIICNGCSFNIDKSFISFEFNRFVMSPTPTELKLLSGLVFDNSFAGTKNSYFISTPDHVDNAAKYLWPEANLNLVRKPVNKTLNQAPDDKGEKQNNSLQRTESSTLLRRTVSLVVRKTSSDRKYKKFLRDPYNYFLDSKSRFVRLFANLYK